MSWWNDIKRFEKLEKTAAISGALQTLYLGKKLTNIAGNIGDNGAMLDAAYDVSNSGQTMDEAIESASNKKYAGAALATLATALALKSNVPLKLTLPTALIALGFTSSYSGEEESYKRLKGKKLMLNNLESLK